MLLINSVLQLLVLLTAEAGSPAAPLPRDELTGSCLSLF